MEPETETETQTQTELETEANHQEYVAAACRGAKCII
jgi:hypothetical protein